MASRSIDSSCAGRSAPTQRSVRRPSPAAAGQWLRILHDTPTSRQVVRQGTRQEVADAFRSSGRTSRRRRMRADLETVIEAGVEAARRLPDPLPTVITHGDFAPRNILVDGSGRLAVIDLLARWQAPPFEDLAGFLVALQTSRANAATRGLVFGRTIAKLEPAFLAGYYGSEPVPRHAIRVYELLLSSTSGPPGRTETGRSGASDASGNG